MSRIAVLSNTHAGANGVEYATALRALGHDVLLIGPRFTQEDAFRWKVSLLEMEWRPTRQEADEYVAKVLAESPVPDIETEKGEWIDDARVGTYDAIVSFWAYGETPSPRWNPANHYIPNALVVGDTHTGHTLMQQKEADRWGNLFVQFRRSDLAAFDHPSKHWLPAAANPTIWRPYPEVEKDLDVLFVGSTHPHVHRDRVALIRYLQDNEINVTVKHAFGSDAARLMARAKVVLNKSLAGDLNMRVMEALACGAWLVTDAVDGMRDLEIYGFEYTTQEQALRATKTALANYNGTLSPQMEGVHRKHSYEARCRTLLQTMGLPEEGDGSVGRTSSASRSDVRNHVRVVGLSSCVDDDAQTPLAHPTVSIIIPAYNHFELTHALIKSLALPESDSHREIILVDDGSTDETKHLPEDWYASPGARVRVLHKSNGGFCSAVNYGVKHAKGEYIVILNNDTTPQEGWLAPLLDELRNGAGIVGSTIFNPDGTLQAAGVRQSEDGTWGNWGGKVEVAYPSIAVPSIQGACFAMRRDTFLRLGGLDEVWGNGGCCEVDLSLRVAKEGLPVRLRLDSRVTHAEGSTRFHVDGIQEKIAENQRRLIERWGMPDVRNGSSNSDGGDVPDPGSSDWTRVRGSDVRIEREGAGTRTVERRPIRVVWEGSFKPQIAGSMAVINAAVCGAYGDGWTTQWREKHGIQLFALPLPIDGDAIVKPDRVDLWVGHYWKQDGWVFPDYADRLALVIPWEVGEPPSVWKQAADDPRLKIVFTPSEYSKGLLAPLFGAERITVVQNGVDLDLFNPDGEKAPGRPDLWRCLFVGGMIWRKGIGHLYDAWRLAFPPEEGAPAVLIIKSQGRTTFYQGQTIEPPADLIRPQNVYPTISVIDRDMEATELAEIYRKVDCLVHPFRYEGFCLPLLESMASGKPVVYSGHAPATEFIPDAAGLAIPSVNHEIDVTSLARGLRWLYEHREDGVAMGAEGRKAAMAYSWPSVAEQYATAIRRICG